MDCEDYYVDGRQRNFFAFNRGSAWSGLCFGLKMGLGTSVRAVAVLLVNSGKASISSPQQGRWKRSQRENLTFEIQ